MKRILCLMLCCLLLCSCGGHRAEYDQPVQFYYLRKEIAFQSADGAIAPETRDCAQCGDDLRAIVSLYLGGPQSSTLTVPYPLGTRLIDVRMQEQIVHVELSTLFSTLSGYELTVACACLGKTLLEYTGAEAVQISAENAELNNEPYITITMDDFVFYDE